MNATYLLQEIHDPAVGSSTAVRSRRVSRAAAVEAVKGDESLVFGLRRTLEADGYDVYVAGEGYLGVPVVIIAPHDQPVGEARGARAVSGVEVAEPLGLSELLTRIRALIPGGDRRDDGNPSGDEARVGARRADEVPGEALCFGDVRIDLAASIVTKGDRRVSLTPRELDLLIAFLRHPGVVLSRATLLREVWGHRAEVVTRTVDIHIAELRRKLEDVPAAPRHIVTVWKRGYRFDP